MRNISMKYTGRYMSPLGDILLTADETGLTGLRFREQKVCPPDMPANMTENMSEECPAINEAKEWLTVYFSGKEPDFDVPLHFTGTAFQNEVREILCTVPYGHTISYGEIARRIAVNRGIPRMSARAVGGAVGSNPVSIIVPCHRVIGSDGNLTGYAGGPDKKIALLTLEGAMRKYYYIPDKIK